MKMRYNVPMDAVRIRMRIYGRVQGVNFRSLARREAQALGLSGFVRNEPDGTLIIEVEGHRESVDSFVGWAKRGPSHCFCGNFHVYGSCQRKSVAV